MPTDLIKEFITDFLPNHRLYRSNIFHSLVSRLYHPKSIKCVEEIVNNNKGQECLDNIYTCLGIKTKITAGELPNKPNNEPLIIVSNHPMGITDIAVVMHMARQYKDIKFLGAKIFEVFDPETEVLIPVDMNKVGNTANPKQAAENHLKQNKTLFVFPSGAVSKLISFRIQDPKWFNSFVSLASKSGARILPIRTQGRNSIFYHMIALLFSARTSAFFHGSEMVKRSNSEIAIKIGDPVDVEQLLRFGLTENEISEKIRNTVYSL